MIVDNDLTNFDTHKVSERGDTGRERVEHRSYSKLRFTHIKGIGHLNSCLQAREMKLREKMKRGYETQVP
jgi:hypothetical protein